MIQLNKYIHVTKHQDTSGQTYYNVVNTRSGSPIGVFAKHPEIGEVVFQTGEKTWWNYQCINDVIEFIHKKITFTYKLLDDLEFEKIEKKNRKTPIYRIKNKYFADKKTKKDQTQISWYSGWRQYCLKSSNDLFRFSEMYYILNKLEDLKK